MSVLRGSSSLASQRLPRAAHVRPFQPCKQQRHVRAQASSTEEPSRRTLLSGLALVPLAAQLVSMQQAKAEEATDAPVISNSQTVGPSRYVDPSDNFSIVVPGGWETGSGFIGGNAGFSGASGQRRTLAFFPPGKAADTNVTITITNTSAEFTRLGSFGSATAFGENLVNSMDRSFLLRAPEWSRRSNGPIPIAKLLDAKEVTSSNGGAQYFVEYTIRKDVDAPQRHMSSLVALAYNGRYNRLYTVTAQCLEDEFKDYKPALQQVLASFEPPAASA